MLQVMFPEILEPVSTKPQTTQQPGKVGVKHFLTLPTVTFTHYFITVHCFKLNLILVECTENSRKVASKPYSQSCV